MSSMDEGPQPGLPSGEDCRKQPDPEQLGCPLVRRLLDVYGESEIPSTSGKGERKFIFDSSHFALVTRLQTGDFPFSVNLVTTPAFGRGVVDLY